jgi:uncharacterized protein with HEPN domain
MLAHSHTMANTASWDLIPKLLPKSSRSSIRYNYCLIGIGEALKEVPADVLASEASTPWESIIGMRNRLVHVYWRIDDDIVFAVATMELPTLGIALERIIKRLT